MDKKVKNNFGSARFDSVHPIKLRGLTELFNPTEDQVRKKIKLGPIDHNQVRSV